MDLNGSIYKYQFGFRQRYSTQQAIITLVEKITSSLDEGDLVIGVFLDFKKEASNTVHHKIIIKQLYSYGIRGNILKWVESYLTDRYQYVVYNGVQSNYLPITCRVSQGSIPWPSRYMAVYVYNKPINHGQHVGRSINTIKIQSQRL